MQQLLQWDSNECYILRVCVCRFRYTAWNALATYCPLWPAGFLNIVPLYLINGTIFDKESSNIKIRVLNICTSFVCNVSQSRNSWAKYDQKCVLDVKYSTRYSWTILMKFRFSLDRFWKNTHIKHQKYSSNGSRVVPCGQTDVRTYTRVRTLIVATIYLQLIQNRYMFRSFTLLQEIFKRFSTPVQTGPEAHPASCTMGTGSFPEGKVLPGRDADPSPPSSAEV